MMAIDLFAGSGGFTEGAESVPGVKVIWAANHWRLAVDVHSRNHPETEHACQDMHQTDWTQVPSMDLVLASPCCQGHSAAASRGGTGKRGTAPHHDALRSTAWAVVSCVEVHRPPFVLVENVTDFMNWTLYDVWKAAMTKLGYALHENVVDAADLGVPQERKRLFITAVRAKSPLVLKLPKRPRVGFSACLDPDAGNWELVAKKPPAVRERVAKGRVNFPRGMFITQHVTGHPGRSLDRPIGTITTKHHWAVCRPSRRGDEMRMLNVDEHRCAMGFPKGYWLPRTTCDSVKLLGNAVCPPVAKAIVAEIMRRV